MSRTGVVTYDFFPLIGGIGRHTYLMFQRMAGADLLFFSPQENSLPRHFRIRFWPVSLCKQVGVSLWLHLQARRIVQRHRLDKLNIHSGPGGVLLVRKLPVPVVVTCHHTYWQQVRHIRSQLWKRIFLPFERRTYRLADRIVCVSRATKDALVEQYGVPAEKITLIYNAVDTESFRPLGIPKKERSILYVGRIDKRKGIEFLIRSMPLVCREIPDAVLQVGGKGAHLGRMKELVRRLKLERNVSFLGFVPEGELNRFYNEAQCVVVPSIFEGFGITVIEALAAGTRVVGTDADGIREILQGGEYGRLVRYGDCAGLAGAIVSELKEPQAPQQLGAEYRMSQFLEGYREVL